MSGYYYLDIALKFQDQNDEDNLVLTPAYFKGSIDQSLRSVFGEIGGLTDIDIFKFDPDNRRAIVRVPEDYYVKTRAAITLISNFQDIPCHFQMSLCQSFGKDKVIFVTKEDHATPSTIELPPPTPQPGLITEEGDINWGCPCLGGMATGPCGVQFRDAFSCFHYSEADPKGSDCYDAFKEMQDCFTLYPTVYNKSGGSGDDDDDMDLSGMGESMEVQKLESAEDPVKPMNAEKKEN